MSYEGVKQAIVDSVKKYEQLKVGILFSGGVDSSLIAKILPSASLYSVAVEGSSDMDHLKKCSEIFPNLRIRIIGEHDVMEYARKVCSMGFDNPVDVSIGIVMYAALEAANEKIILSGQGADELFGGYHRYLRADFDRLEFMLRMDLEKLKEVDVPRDRRIASNFSISLEFPYLDPGVVGEAFKIPAREKIKDGIRKYPLRVIASELGVPEFIAWREKRAIQYSSGVANVLRKESRRRRMRMDEYIRSLR